MLPKYLLLLLPFLLCTTGSLAQAQQGHPTRELGDFFSSVSAKELHELSRTLDKKEEIRMAGELGLRLTTKEKGGKWTVHCTSGGPTGPTMHPIRLANDSAKSLVRIDDERVYVKLYALTETDPGPKLKECRAGRKIFMTGAVRSIGIGKSSEVRNALLATIIMEVDDIGLDK